MKLLHVSSGSIFGGIETVLVSLARNGARWPGLEQGFALCFEGRLNEELRALDVPVYMLGETWPGRPWSVLRGRKALRDVIEHSGCDLVVCHGSRSMALFAATVRVSKKPLVMWVHGVKPRNHWLNWRLRKLPPDLAICNSQFTGRKVTELFPGVESAVIYHPLQTTAVSHSAFSKEEVRKAFGASVDDTVIVQVSRMVAWKGHLDLIRALSGLESHLPWRCWLVGGAQGRAGKRYFEELRSTVRRSGLDNRVKFLGQRNDVGRILGAADIFCQPNRKAEAFGMVFVEAMLAGLPVVTSEMGAATEVVDPGTGILVPAKDPAALERSLRKLLANPSLRQRLGAQGPARARKLCEPGARLRELQKVLEPLVFRHQLSVDE